MHFVYILKCADNTLYTGYTPDLEARLKKHADKKGAKYTKSRLPFTLIYTEEFPDKISAMKREYEIKQWSRAKKIKELGLVI